MPEMKWEPVEMYMQYESMTINDDSIRAAIAKATAHSVFDKPYVLQELIPERVIKCSLRFPLEPGTRFAVLAILSGHQLKADSRGGNFQACRYQFMDKLDKVQFGLVGAQGLVVGGGTMGYGGLENIGSGNNSKNTISTSLKMLHQYMYREGLTNKRWDEWTPPMEVETYDSYEKLIPIDLSPYMKYINDDKQTNLTIDMSFDSPGSRPNYYAVLFCVQQYHMSYAPGTGHRADLLVR
jgi:hypothetical protein